MNADRFPVIVGVAQIEQRADDFRTAREPLALMIDATRAAADDAGSAALLAQASSVRIVRGIWPYRNPARTVAEAIGNPLAETGLTPIGGNQVQSAVNRTAIDILEGRHDVVIVAGAECGATQAKAQKAGVRPQWSEAPGEPDVYLGHDVSMSDEAERARGIRAPIQIYPMFENALRAARGESIEQHVLRISELWAGFARVAAGNPHAWIRRPVSASDIRTTSKDNRPISFPYPKLMNANSRVDMGAALILASVGAAQRLGIPASKWVYLWSGADAHDHLHVSHRDTLDASPAIRIAGTRALELAGVSIEDIDHVDLYSCFPSAVQVAANELGLSHARPLTVTGGLTFAGGPLNNYVMHAIATMVERCRAHPDDTGLVTANGGFLTKHAIGVYAAAPPPRAYRHADVQHEIDRLPRRDVLVDFDGPVTIESYTVMHGDAGAQTAHCACRTDDERRTWANSVDPGVLAAMQREEFCGRRARVDGAGNVTF